MSFEVRCPSVAHILAAPWPHRESVVLEFLQRRTHLLRRFVFRLRKWYLDCVASDGTTFIGYAARVGSGPVLLSYQATLWRPTSGPARAEYSILPARLPRLGSDELRWGNPRLDVRGSWCGTSASTRHVLLDTRELRVDWRCHLPGARASVSTRCGTVRGSGYCEELILEGDPRRLPIHELHWGRFVERRTSLVWIEWRGEHPLKLVALDGKQVSASRIDEDQVRFEGGTLRIEDPRPIRADDVGSAIFGDSRWKRAMVPNVVARWREEKWLSRGRLTRPGAPMSAGWVVHERVGLR
jgi:hypothetical protein